MTALLGPLLVLAGFALYFVTSTRLGRFRRIPWEWLAVSGLGAAIAVGNALAHGGALGWASALTSLALLGFLLWFFFGFTMYGPREDRPRVGDPFPAFRLPASDGSLFDLAEHRGKRILLIFYRGSW
jgi:hypothetical protein